MDEQVHWLEVSLVVSGELAEAVADVLGRFVSNGVVVESGVTFNDTDDEGTPFGPVKVFGYLPVDEALEQNRHRLEEAFWHLGQIQTLPALNYKVINDEDWMAAWKQHYHPILIGQRLLVLPVWLENPAPDRVVVKIDPSMAFGTGTHPTTQLCLELLERYILPGEPVIDVGCGSGILSIAALKLGASQVLAVDIDSQAVRSTRENATNNAITQDLESELGSVPDILQGNFALRQAPLVLANILAPVIIRLLDDGLAELIQPGGVIIVSGILDRQTEDVLVAAQNHGLVEIDRGQILDWVALVLRK